MVLNRATRKEAENRLSALRRQVFLHVFSHRFEDGVCRELRQAAEELAEASRRLSVEISDASESGDLLRKFRIDSIPALVATGKDMPEFRIYGLPLAYAFPALLDALLAVGAAVEPKQELVELLEQAGAAGRQSVRLDLVLSRHESTCGEAAAALWRAVAAERAAGSSRSVPSLRILEDAPQWAVQAGSGAFPTLLADGKRLLTWPFTDADIAVAMTGS